MKLIDNSYCGKKYEFYTITVQGHDYVLDGPAFEEGYTHFAIFGGSDQCEDCGSDLTEANADPNARELICTCGAVYECRPAKMVGDWVEDE